MAGLITAGCFSLSAALLHIFIIIGGAEWYRFFGAGEELAQLAEQGSFIPAFITLVITLVFLIWSLYAFSGAGLIRHLPWLKPILITITLIYLIRGLGLLPLFILSPNLIDTFLIVSSIISLVIGVVHLIGIRQMVQPGSRN
jgi:putative oxidoreductase